MARLLVPDRSGGRAPQRKPRDAAGVARGWGRSSVGPREEGRRWSRGVVWRRAVTCYLSWLNRLIGRMIVVYKRTGCLKSESG